VRVRKVASFFHAPRPKARRCRRLLSFHVRAQEETVGLADLPKIVHAALATGAFATETLDADVLAL